MTGNDIFILTKQILGGGSGEYTLSETLFYSLLAMAQMNLEDLRNWQVLKSTDKSLTASSGNNWDVSLTLPADFKKLSTDGVIRLYDLGNNTKITLHEVPMEKQLEYRNIFGHFSIDYGAKKLYIYGNVPQPYTIWLPYVIENTTITANTSWLRFRSGHMSIFPFIIAAMHRSGINYDDVNARNAVRNMFDSNEILNSMISWDSSLQLSSCTNEDYTEED